MGFGVTTCTTAEEALAFLRDQSFDVLFTDIVMPGSLDGPALARGAKVVRPGVRVVMTTGFSPEPYDDLENAQILKKPYARADLQAVFGSIRFDAADVGDSVR